MKFSFLFFIPFLFLLASCSVGPDIGLVNVLPDNEIIFDNNGSIYDNVTCTTIKSPGNNGTNSTNFVHVCDDNSVHFEVMGIETAVINPTGVVANGFSGNGENLTDINMSQASFWKQNSTTLYYNDTTRDVFIEGNLSINSLVIRDPNSIKIFSGFGDVFATFSAQNFTSTSLNQTRVTVTLDKDLTIQNNYNGTTYMSNANQNSHPNSSAVVSASDILGAGMILQKYNQNHESSWMGRVASYLGDVKMSTTYNNVLGLSGYNKLRFGFYQNIALGDEFTLGEYINETFPFDMNATAVRSLERHEFNESIYMRTDTAHPQLGDHMPIWNDGTNWFTTRLNGQDRRFSLVGAGSQVFDELIIINNDTILNGSLSLNQFSGVGDAYVCFNSTGGIFRSNTAC